MPPCTTLKQCAEAPAASRADDDLAGAAAARDPHQRLGRVALDQVRLHRGVADVDVVDLREEDLRGVVRLLDDGVIRRCAEPVGRWERHVDGHDGVVWASTLGRDLQCELGLGRAVVTHDDRCALAGCFGGSVQRLDVY